VIASARDRTDERLHRIARCTLLVVASHVQDDARDIDQLAGACAIATDDARAQHELEALSRATD
jgi:hypothetical protein